ncbi:hypothetical protein N7463_001266 [Penicillium fimorum]|uniref:Uncharacterized protein n=1 Tax=Penicillium fimorum TaxID=1882269 RepID=A0A9X0CCT8_9EURO|nr:hypothetical protein N7463_001266 [Penicillium fimorum]
MKPGGLWIHDNSSWDRSWWVALNCSFKASYRHKITGAKSHIATDMLGGILADDMGLGKTLTMVAAITSSVSHAESYANGILQNTAMMQAAGKIPAKSTLVIVPSPLLTTYGTIATEFNRGGGALNHFRWYRLVLDEAHIIRNSSTQTFKAVMNLSAAIRWCMSGTPVQNSLDDLESLVKFLRVPVLDDSSTFRRFITGTSLAGNTPKPKHDNLRVLLGSICLRRNTSILSELGVSFQVHRPVLSASESRAYRALETACKERIKAAVSFKRGKGEPRIVLTAILLLRIFCNTGINSTLTLENFVQQSKTDEISSLKLQSGETVCMECNTDMPPLATDCTPNKMHLLDSLICHECMARNLIPADHTSSSRDLLDSGCEAANAAQGQGQSASTRRSGETPHSSQPTYPSKLMALLADIKEHYSEEKRFDNLPAKALACTANMPFSIVFSYWRRTLDLVGHLFNEEGITYCRVDGAVHSLQRKKVLQRFHEDPLTRVLLITQGTGSVGLNNLSVASRVHILEPQWNPSIENQAIGRVLRLGQDKRVFVVRYVVQGTIEEASSGRNPAGRQVDL